MVSKTPTGYGSDVSAAGPLEHVPGSAAACPVTLIQSHQCAFVGYFGEACPGLQQLQSEWHNYILVICFIYINGNHRVLG